MYDVAAIIVAHNAARELPACIGSLRDRTGGCRLELVVVDSGSRDLTADVANEQGASCVSYPNIGYGAGNNVGRLVAAPARYLLVLNPDARLVEGSLDSLVAHADRHPQVGVFAPRVVTSAGRATPSIAPFEGSWRRLASGFRGRDVTGCGEPVQDMRPFDWASGCALFIRAECFDQVGGFDERFFLYAEERDLLRATQAAGWLHQTYPDLAVCHESTGRPPDARLFAQRFRADLYYARKWGGIAALLATRGALTIELLRRLLLGRRDEWTASYLAALRVVLTEGVRASPGRAREIQRRRTLGPREGTPWSRG